MYKVRTGILKKSDLPEFNWTEDCQEGFDNLKRALTSAPILAYPDYSKPFILEMDASLKGLGAVLSQCSDDKHRSCNRLRKSVLETRRKVNEGLFVRKN